MNFVEEKYYLISGKNKYMSRIGKENINIPSGATLEISNNLLKVKGSKGEISKKVDLDLIKFEVKDNILTLTPLRNDKETKALWGTYASHIKNMIKGVLIGFEKKLLIDGVGFRWEVKGDKLQLNLGFSHPVIISIPKEISVVADKGILTISGIDLEKVSLFAMQVRKLKRVEPYKGKGIRYEKEVVIRKQGKKSA